MHRLAQLAVSISMVMVPTSGQTQPTVQCFTRDYSFNHLAQHPQQTVTSFTLSLSVPRDGSHSQFAVWVATRGKPTRLFTGGTCVATDQRANSRLSCAVDCDGGGIGVEGVTPDGSVLVHLAQPWGSGELQLNSSCGGDDNANGYTLKAGIDDRVFKLAPAPLQFCQRLEATLPRGERE